MVDGIFQFILISDNTLEVGIRQDVFLGDTDSIKIPEKYNNCVVTKISDYGFNKCNNLKEIILPESITEIGEKAFRNCSSLEDIIIPKGVTHIGYKAFSKCTSLKTISLPDTVVTLGTYVFDGCTSLKLITIPKNVQCISEGLLRDCYSLLTVTIPEGVTKINFGAFEGCKSLESITLPESVIEIRQNAFVNCVSLNSIQLPYNIIDIQMDAFLNTGYYNNASNWDNGLLFIGKYLVSAKPNLSGIYKISPSEETTITSGTFCSIDYIKEIEITNATIGSCSFQDVEINTLILANCFIRAESFFVCIIDNIKIECCITHINAFQNAKVGNSTINGVEYSLPEASLIPVIANEV